ncbi:MAG: hypothetical protein LBN09_07250 [Clostridioides sp.]|jgi:hypothetical protein|nr:hypothetical protein [Clostridioides sp.]
MKKITITTVVFISILLVGISLVVFRENNIGKNQLNSKCMVGDFDPTKTRLSTSVEGGGHLSNLYLSITATSYDNGKDPDGGMTTSTYIYDLETKKLENKRAGAVEYTSQYPLSVYDKSNNTIYYTASDESGKRDEVFSYNLGTMERKQLTTELFAVNYILPYKDNILIVGVKRFERELKPFLLDKSTNKLNSLKTPEGFDCWTAHYNPITKKTILQGWIQSERERLTSEFGYDKKKLKDSGYKLPKTYFYELVDNELKLYFEDIYRETENISTDLSGNIIYADYSYKDIHKIPDGHIRTWYTWRKGSDKVPAKTDLFSEGSTSDYPSEEITYVSKEFYYLNENTIIFLGYPRDKNEDSYGIYAYDIKKNEYKTIIESEEELGGYINNFTLLSKDSL